MGSYNDFLSRLSPKDAREIKTAAESKIEKIPLASRRLTRVMQGGIARGQITTIYGNFSAGKTMLTLQSIGEWQKQGLVCGFIDVEGTLDGDFARRLGVNVDELVVDGSRVGRKVGQTCSKWLQAGIDVIAIDSISAIMPDAFVDEKNDKLDDKRIQIGAHAKTIKNLIHGIHYENKNTAVILLSQTTSEIGQTYVKQVPHGGKRVGFDSISMIKLTSSATDSNKQRKGLVQVGNVLEEMNCGREVEAFLEKNKAGPQHRGVKYDIYYDGDFVGIDSAGELADMCIDTGIINKSGAWFKYDDLQWQGRLNMVKDIRENVVLAAELEKRLDGLNYDDSEEGEAEYTEYAEFGD